MNALKKLKPVAKAPQMQFDIAMAVIKKNATNAEELFANTIIELCGLNQLTLFNPIKVLAS